MSTEQNYVAWFRNSAPYINAHRNRIFVIQFDGEVVDSERFAGVIHDIALLNSLGVRLVIVHGARPQIEQRLAAAGLSPAYAGGMRVTDAAALEAAKEAVGVLRLEVESRLSMGLPNSPMAGARIRVVSGNFVTARPLGVRDGVDFRYTGEVRRIDGHAIRSNLESGAVVLLSPLGCSPTGEVFNLLAEEVATAVAIELHAAKLLFLGKAATPAEDAAPVPTELSLAQASETLAQIRKSRPLDDPALAQLTNAVRACRNGVSRVHLLDQNIDGAILLELFTRDGVGTMVNADAYDAIRRADVDDVGGILELIQPLEAQGILVRRSREKLEMEIGQFHVVERDGAIVACAAAYPFNEGNVMELACLAVHDDYRNGGRGDALLNAVESQARGIGAKQLLVLTTQTSHWFKERGFVDGAIEDLPVERKFLYNYQRNSKVLVKEL
ncbi:MAG: amino-acid N-acetyltransferase [Gammaproteobacteria bacterium]|nr:amino-acid N-acetyltransferase [Gammaproteobacteria bacterium]MDH3412136.1 amino-acid N-acetyltransferase [Gammaproteobacteria bacterium]